MNHFTTEFLARERIAELHRDGASSQPRKDRRSSGSRGPHPIRSETATRIAVAWRLVRRAIAI
jgi:hypothetical protein